MNVLSQVIGGIGLALLFFGCSLAIPNQELLTAFVIAIGFILLFMGAKIDSIYESEKE